VPTQPVILEAQKPSPLDKKPSLRERLVRHVMGPLALTWLLGTAVAVGVSYFFAQKAFDRALLDDAYALASHVRLVRGDLSLELSSVEMRSLLFDQSERVFFAVLRPNGALLAGHPGLQAPSLGEAGRTRFDDSTYQGQAVRVVVVRIQDPAPFDVVVALTQGSRNQLLNNLIMFSLIPQLVFLLLLTWWLRRSIGQDLAPLAQLQQGIAARDAQDLTPMPVTAPSRDVQQLALTLNELFARVNQSMQAQREFSGNVAHELKTPLAGIRALTDYALSHTDAAVWREQLQRIASSEARASRLVEQLLALALAEEADTAIATEIVALDEVVQETVLRYLARADSLGVDLGVAGLEQAVHIKGNRALIEGMLGNLIDNALRYGGAHDAQVGAQDALGRTQDRQVSTVTVSLSSHQGVVRVCVSDNGAGLTPDECQRYMQRGVRGVRADRLGQGAGLGLAIVAKFAKVMRARFELGPASEGSGLRAMIIFSPTA
jgi:two-component system, OmpR family, sensor histidine kinase TctE